MNEYYKSLLYNIYIMKQKHHAMRVEGTRHQSVHIQLKYKAQVITKIKYIIYRRYFDRSYWSAPTVQCALITTEDL